jgi:hypothetical protein
MPLEAHPPTAIYLTLAPVLASSVLAGYSAKSRATKLDAHVDLCGYEFARLILDSRYG